MKKKFIFFIMLFTPFMVIGQTQPEVVRLSLDQAVERAIGYNKQYKSAQLDIDLKKQQIRESISQGLPQINGSLAYSTNFGESMNLSGMTIKMKDQFNLGVSASQLLFSGQWILGVKTAKIAKQIAIEQVNSTELDIVENVHNSYYNVLVCEHLSKILDMNLSNVEQLLNHTKNMYKAGTVEPTNVSEMEVNYNQIQNSIHTMQRNIDVSYNLLRLQLGLEAGTPIVLTDSLDSFLNEDDFNSTALQEFNIGENLQYKLMLTQENLQKKMVGLQKWSFAPTISANYSYQYQIKEGGFMNIPHSGGITMNIPLFSGLQRKAQLETQKITLEQVQINKSLLEDNLNLQENQLKFALKNAIDDFILQKRNVDVAKKVLDNYSRKYKFGAISSLEYTQANTNYLQAENTYTSSCLTVLEAKTKLEKLHNSLNK